MPNDQNDDSKRLSDLLAGHLHDVRGQGDPSPLRQ